MNASIFAELERVEVLRCLSEWLDPDLFLTADPRGRRHLALLAGGGEGRGYDLFVVAPLGDERLQALRDRTLSIRSALVDDPSSVRVVIEYVAADWTLNYRTFVPAHGIPDDVLPGHGVVLETFGQYLDRTGARAAGPESGTRERPR